MKVYQKPLWAKSNNHQGLNFYCGGFFEEGEQRVPTKTLYFEEIPPLVEALENEGFLKPRLDERLRTEDLKITHRLLDLLDNFSTKTVYEPPRTVHEAPK